MRVQGVLGGCAIAAMVFCVVGCFEPGAGGGDPSATSASSIPPGDPATDRPQPGDGGGASESTEPDDDLVFDSDEEALAYANGLVERGLELAQRFPDLSDDEVEQYLELFGGPARENAEKLIDRREKYALNAFSEYAPGGLIVREPIAHGEKVIVRFCLVGDPKHPGRDPRSMAYFLGVGSQKQGSVNEIRALRGDKECTE